MRKWLLHIIPAPAPLMIAQLTNYRGRDNVVTISILSTIYYLSDVDTLGTQDQALCAQAVLCCPLDQRRVSRVISGNKECCGNQFLAARAAQ